MSSSEEFYSSDDDEDSYNNSSDYYEDEEATLAAAAAKRPRIDQENVEGEDRISSLPDPIISHILSLLPSTQEAIQTSVLSNRWRFLWTSVTSLSFSHGNRVSSITDTLFQCSSPKLKKFKIEKYYENRIPSCLNKWVRFAVNRNVEELHIYLTHGPPKATYKLPSHLFTNSVFTSLLLGGGNFLFRPTGLISWKQLRYLRIDGTELTNDLIGSILLGSPVLETLEFGKCHGFNRVDIDTPRMRKFVLDGYGKLYEQGENTVLEITAPYITSLDVKGRLLLKDIVLLDVHSLFRANFAFSFSEVSPRNTNTEDTWKGILQSVQHVNELSFGESCFEVLSLEGEHLHSAPLKCKCLIIGFNGRRDLIGLMNLLQSLPDLESLVIKENNKSNKLPDIMAVENHLSSKESAFVHLKTVEIVYTEDWALDLIEIIQFLLKNAHALEEVVVHAGSQFPKKIIGESGAIIYTSFAAASRRVLQLIRKQLDSCRTNKAVIRFVGFDI